MTAEKNKEVEAATPQAPKCATSWSAQAERSGDGALDGYGGLPACRASGSTSWQLVVQLIQSGVVAAALQKGGFFR